MKKFFVTLFAAAMGLSAFAQEVDPNRLILVDKSGNYKSYVVDNVDHLEFRTVEGEVAADVEILDVTLEGITISVQRTEACQAFKLACYASNKIANASDVALANAVDQESKTFYSQDFPSAQMTGMDFEPKTSYTIVTLGYDSYGTPVGVRRAEFTTPAIPVQGNPSVDMEVVSTDKYSFTLKFTPNADVSKYSFVAGEVGTMQSQYEMFAPMFGYSNFGQMIESWGIAKTEVSEYTYTNMQPGTEYEVFVQSWDVNGTMADYQVYTVSTDGLGGTGTAEVTISLGKYVLNDWNGEQLPSQFMTFTPNDQAAAYRFAVYTAAEYDPEADAIKQELCSEPPMPMKNWFFYEEITTDYQINPNIECVAIAAAKNANGEWGPVTENRFTTPAEVESGDTPEATATSKLIKGRNMSKNVKVEGMIPTLKQQELKLVAR